MNKFKTALVRYERPLESVRKAVDLCDGLADLPSDAKVFIKPNVVFWCRGIPFPKWGVITTSRVVEDMVTILKEHGIDDITIGEGMVLFDPKDKEIVTIIEGWDKNKEKYEKNPNSLLIKGLDFSQRILRRIDPSLRGKHVKRSR